MSTNEFLSLQSDRMTVRGVSAGEGRISVGGSFEDAVITVSDEEVDIISICSVALSNYEMEGKTLFLHSAL